MKKSYLLILLAVMLALVACSKANNEKEANIGKTTSEAVENGGKIQGSTSISDSVELTQKPVEPTPTPFPTDDVKDYEGFGMTFEDENLLNAPDKDSFVLKELEANTELHLVGKYNDKWYLAECEGARGYISCSNVATAKAMINADEVKLRKGPSTTEDILSVMGHSTPIYTINQKNGWYKVVLDNEKRDSGYVFADYVSYYDGYVNSANVRLRELPNTDSETLTRIEQGKRVAIVCKYGDWYKVIIDQYTGFMSAQYIEYSATVVKTKRQNAYILDNGVNFREGPSIECKAIERLAKFAPVVVTGETDEWYRVVCNEVEGYVSKDFVEFGKLEVYVTGQDVNLRAGPSTHSDLLTKVRQNSKFEIIGCEGEWLKGIVNHNTGYIRSDYLSAKTVNNGKTKDEFTSSEVYLVAKVLYLETRGMEGYRAVANVIYNRVKSHRFQGTIEGVVYAPGQFSHVGPSRFTNIKPSSDAIRAANQVLNEGIRPLPFNVLFYHAASAGKNWGSEKRFYKTIGGNSFFRYVG